MLRLIVALALLAPAASYAATYEIDPMHSAAHFKVRHMMVSNVHGQFGKLSGTINYDEKDPAKSTVEATIDVTTVDTQEPKRDEHLKSAEFFDVAQFPTMTFKSTKVEKAGKGKLKVHGNLTLHGVTKPVVLEVEGPAPEAKDPFYGKIKSGATASTKLNRKDFGLAWNKALETGGVMVGEEVAITIEIELNKQVPAEAAKAP